MTRQGRSEGLQAGKRVASESQQPAKPLVPEIPGKSRGFRFAAPGLSRLKQLLPRGAGRRQPSPVAEHPPARLRLTSTPARKRIEARAAESADRSGSQDAELYPAFVKLRDRRCLVVGGGPVALQKTLELLRAGAAVKVVARRWPADFGPLDGDVRLVRETRDFAPLDLEGVFLVVAATNDADAQREIWKGADSRGILCNVVDVPDLCNFYVPASVRRGALTVSVSTAGKSPLFAVALRDRLARLLGKDLGPALEILAEARHLVRSRYPDDHAKRRTALGRLLTPEAIDRLMEGNLEAFEVHERAWTSSLSD